MAEDNTPEFHDRHSIHPAAVAQYREALLELVGIEDAEEVEALSDWQVVRQVERIQRLGAASKKADQALARAAKGAAARMAAFGEALIPIQAEQLANETELFLAIDHSE